MASEVERASWVASIACHDVAKIFEPAAHGIDAVAHHTDGASGTDGNRVAHASHDLPSATQGLLNHPERGPASGPRALVFGGCQIKAAAGEHVRAR